jgi:hypothetical protein
VPSSASQSLLYTLSLSLSLCASQADISDLHGRRRPNFGRFCASSVTCPRELISISPCCTFSLSLCTPPADTSDTDDDGRVLNGSAHLLSRVLVSQSASVASCTPCVSLSLCKSFSVVPAGHAYFAGVAFSVNFSSGTM